MWINREISSELEAVAASFPVLLLIDRGQSLAAVECKITEKPAGRDARGLFKLAEFYGPELISSLTIACPSCLPFTLSCKVDVRPGWSSWEIS